MLTLALVGATGTACGGDDDAGPASTLIPVCTPGPTEAVALEGKSAVFDLTGIADPIGAATEDGYIVINARAAGTIEDLATKFMQMVTDAGFDVAGSEQDEADGEVFLAKGDVAAGQIRMRESDCAGFVDVTISVLDDPAVFPS